MQKLPNGEATGMAEAVAEIVWPPRIVQPARPPALVYLDLNHYIYLARAAAGLTAPEDTTACCGQLPSPGGRTGPSSRPRFEVSCRNKLSCRALALARD
jgi:hypothetical protein